MTYAFHPADEARLVARAIDPQLAWDEGARSMDEGELRHLFARSDIVDGGICYAYNFVEHSGLLGSYARAHLREPSKNSFKAITHKGKTPPPYFLATAQSDLSAGRAALQWLLTESPEKALALRSNGFAEPVGLGGVDAGCFEKSEKGKPPVLQALIRRFIKPGDRLYVVMDAGRSTNAAVARAEAKLAKAFRLYGCETRLVQLPLYQGDDQGVDDYLAREGQAAFADLLKQAVPSCPVAWAMEASRG